MIILGLDPSLSCTGWGVIRAEGNRLSHVANGQIRTDAKTALPARLVQLYDQLCAVIAQHQTTLVAEQFSDDRACHRHRA